jgi:hypothetical protein
MRDYGRVSPQFWIGTTGKRLRGDSDAQIVALYLQTSPHATMIGIFHCPIQYIAHETGLTLEEASKGLGRLIDEGFCSYDHERELVWVNEMAKFQIASSLKPNDNQVKAIVKAFEQIPECQIRQGFHAKYKTAFHLPEIDLVTENTEEASKGLDRGIEAPPKPGAGAGAGAGAGDLLPPDGGSCPQPPAGDTQQASKAESNSCPHEQIIAAYHELLPMGRQVKVWSEARRTKLRARWREDKKRQSLDWWRKFFDYIAKSDFLTGHTSTPGRVPFEIDLEWIVTPVNFVKILEGKFENREAA